ncbi:hypothetical protein [Spongiactinospora sp. TRM90649]|uniref:hypothetical protein n=1 Tax=Spongiactinospora sp. TRM90649 TaxID=3031114 RepID=UPI0023F9E85F|nr:hypothetical protein [Spongiactinospora sp. TRM90649]MDF5752970.1 hypothetical protein [Spongiactinospora sp. TRM90649]
MTIDEMLKRTMREWSEEARVPADLADRAIRRRTRRRVRVGATFAGAVAAAVAAVIVVPGVVGGGTAVLTTPITATPEPPTDYGVSADPDASPPKGRLIGAHDVAAFAYSVWSERKISAERQVNVDTWYLFDDAAQEYRKTEWAHLDIARGGDQVAVLEPYGTTRVGLLDRKGGEVRWIELGQKPGSVQWSPDGRRLLLTTYSADPDEREVPKDNSEYMLPPSRNGYVILEVESGTSRFFPLAEPESQGSGRRDDVRWSWDGGLVSIAPVFGQNDRRYMDLEGKAASAPPLETKVYQQAGKSPDGRRLADESPDKSAITGVRDIASGKVTPVRPLNGHWVEQLAAWAGNDHLIAWACESDGGSGCVKSEFRNRLVLVAADGSTLEPLTGYRENSQKPGSWIPLFTRR